MCPSDERQVDQGAALLLDSAAALYGVLSVLSGQQVPGWSQPAAQGSPYPYPSGATITGGFLPVDELSDKRDAGNLTYDGQHRYSYDAWNRMVKVWKDNRGYFYESFNAKLFADAGIGDDFVQDNQSFSQKGAVEFGLL